MKSSISPISGAASLPLPAVDDAASRRRPTTDGQHHGTDPQLAGLSPRRGAARITVASASASEAPDATRINAMPDPAPTTVAHRANRVMFSIIRPIAFLSTKADVGTHRDAMRLSARGVVFSRSKATLGGSDVGMVGMLDGQEHLVKTGISRSLLGQAVACCAKGNADEANKRLGYIVGSAVRLLDGAIDKQTIQQLLTRAFHAFLDTEKGKALTEKARTEALDIDDVCEIHACLIAADPRLRNPLGVPILFDVVNVAAAQDLVNGLQGRYLSPENIPDSSLLTLPNNALIASRLIHDAEPLDTFLTRPFLPPGVSLAQAKRAAARVKNAAAGSHTQTDELAKEHALLARINDPVALRSGKQALIDTLRHNGLDGLFASLLARLTLGESSDLGPDNMLVILGEQRRRKVISIDVTGFRYDREKDAAANAREPLRYGWGNLVQTPEQALQVLLDASVMSNRYAKGLGGVHAMVIDAIREALAQQATPEVAMVKQWYATLDVDATTSCLRSLGDQLGSMSEAGWMPDAALVNQVLARHSSFLSNVVEKSRQ